MQYIFYIIYIGFNEMRVTFVLDSLYVCAIGLCLTWFFGSFKDAYSYGIGSILGLGYAILLGRYVENLGGEGGDKGGSIRFAPVILLIGIYAKYKTQVSIIPELIGFFSYQAGSFLQAFNQKAYEDND